MEVFPFENIAARPVSVLLIESTEEVYVKRRSKMKTTTILGALLLACVVCNSASALTMLDPGCVAQTYVTYTDSVQGEARHMTFDDSGNLYITQQNEGSVWRVTPQKVASQFATGLLPGVYSITWGGGTAYGNNLYVGNGSGPIYKISPTGTVSSFANIAGNGAASLAVDTTGNYGGYLYAGTGSQDHTYRITTAGNVSLFSNFPGWRNGGEPDGMAFYNGNKYAKAMYMGAAYANPQDAAAAGLFTLDTSGNATRFCNNLVQVWAIGFADETYFDGKLFAIGSTASETGIWSIDSSGIASEIASSSTLNGLALAFGNDGAMYVNEYSSDGLITVSRIVPEPVTLLLLGFGTLMLNRKRRS